MTVFEELKRRNVVRVAIAYLVSAWLLVQVAETILPLFVTSNTPLRVVVVALAIGFPLALIFSWLYEITPEGLKLEREIDRTRSIAHHTGRSLDRGIIVVLTLSLGYFAVDKFILDPGRDRALQQSIENSVRDERIIDSFGDRSIAVLPFVNMSDDAGNAYFSDGISEEILNLLADISDLRVISRTSAFSFRDKDVSIMEIAEALNVDHVLEGSVRKEGGMVRITAQLIQARTDTHLWSEVYDRQLGNVFAIQDQIAAAVVERLKGTLLDDEGGANAIDAEAYALYLQARHIERQQENESLQQAEALYRQSIEIEPGYVPNWIGLGNTYANMYYTGQIEVDEAIQLVQEVTDTALELDPLSAPAHEAMAWIANTRDGDLAAAAMHLQRAIDIEPHDIQVLGGASRLLQDLGRLNEAIDVYQYLIIRNPVDPVIHFNLGALHMYNREYDAATQSLNTVSILSPNFGGLRYVMGLVDLFKENPESALQNFEREEVEIFNLKGRALAYHSLGMREDADALLAELSSALGTSWPTEVAEVHAYRGDVDAAFEWLALELESPGGWGEGRLSPLLNNLHADPRWEEFLTDLGVSDEQLKAVAFEPRLPVD